MATVAVRPVRPGGHAVVIGASMAGLGAAAVLASRFAGVTVLERDELSAGTDARRGVPQARHAHLLLLAGQQVLAGLFPGIVDQLVGAGAVRLDADGAFVFHGGAYRDRTPVGLPVTMMSRTLLEATVRARLADRPNVSVLGGRAARGLLTDDHGGRVVGVSVETGSERSEVAADLVVDTTGRAVRSLRWLEELGHPPPAVSTVTVDVGYATRLLRRGPDDLRRPSVFAALPQAPDLPRMGVLLPIEGNRWICSLAGAFGQAPPTDEDGFAAFASSLAAPDVANALARCEPIGDIVAHRFPSSQRRRFERLRRPPAGFVALGDAFCSFDPIYGQGMTSALLQAEALGACLDRHDAASFRLPGAFYRRAASVVASPWRIAVGGDFAFPQTTGDKPLGTDALNRYVARAVLASHSSASVNRTLFRVQNLLAPPALLLTPRTVWNVVRAAPRSPAARRAAASAAGG